MGKQIPMGKNQSIVKIITQSLNKHGEIKGRDKQETKNLKDMCMHHKLTKKGVLRPAIYNDGNGVCTCELCGKKFTTHLATKGEIKDVTANLMQYVDQAKYSTVAADLGKQTEGYLADLSIKVRQFKKVYSRVKKAINKKENTKKKKKKSRRGNNGSDSDSFGSWR